MNLELFPIAGFLFLPLPLTPSPSPGTTGAIWSFQKGKFFSIRKSQQMSLPACFAGVGGSVSGVGFANSEEQESHEASRKKIAK
jgi:hypothetical protein